MAHQRFSKAGIHHDALAAQLQKEGAEAFVKSWKDLLGVVTSKTEAPKKAG